LIIEAFNKHFVDGGGQSDGFGIGYACGYGSDPFSGGGYGSDPFSGGGWGSGYGYGNGIGDGYGWSYGSGNGNVPEEWVVK
jgi:hypothetical protein